MKKIVYITHITEKILILLNNFILSILYLKILLNHVFQTTRVFFVCVCKSVIHIIICDLSHISQILYQFTNALLGSKITSNY